MFLEFFFIGNCYKYYICRHKCYLVTVHTLFAKQWAVLNRIFFLLSREFVFDRSFSKLFNSAESSTVQYNFNADNLTDPVES